MPASDNERAFFFNFGGRITRLRKQQNATQAQLAKLHGITRQKLNLY